MSLDRRIWQITYPIFLGLLAQNIINVTDTAFLGRVGEVALGAAGMGGLYYITSSFLISLGIILILFVIDALLWEWEENRKIKQRKRDHNHQTSDHQ